MYVAGAKLLFIVKMSIVIKLLKSITFIITYLFFVKKGLQANAHKPVPYFGKNSLGDVFNNIVITIPLTATVARQVAPFITSENNAAPQPLKA